jgi:phosphoribosylaminoimidazole-succinocarboxamide synthase
MKKLETDFTKRRPKKYLQPMIRNRDRGLQERRDRVQRPEKRDDRGSREVVNTTGVQPLLPPAGKQGIPTHYIEQLSDRETAVKRVQILPSRSSFENRAGSFSKRMGLAEGTALACRSWSSAIKRRAWDPFINSYYVRAAETSPPTRRWRK